MSNSLCGWQVEDIGDMLSPTSLTPLEIITNLIWSCHQQIIQYQAVLFYQRLVVQLLRCLRAVKLLVILSSLKLFKNRKFRFRIKLFLTDLECLWMLKYWCWIAARHWRFSTERNLPRGGGYPNWKMVLNPNSLNN